MKSANRVDQMRFYGGWLSPNIRSQLAERVALANSKGWKLHQVNFQPVDSGSALFNLVLVIISLGAFSLGRSIIVTYERDDRFEGTVGS